ncbi:MAG: hypothetical protein GWP59_02620 [Chlamydiales bacterium]|nr:hypothetical protein [Chlamydiales bacterium]
MLQVFVPEKFFSERSYILDILLEEFLGLEFQVFIAPQQEYRIVCENGNELIIRDDFFAKIKGNDYLSAENLPIRTKILGQSPIYDRSLPIIFGEDYLSITQNTINCGADIFASSFFLLTRWEESVLPAHEKSNSFIISSDLYKRPVVNEYVECLWKMLSYLGVQQERKKKSFNFKLLHNVLHLKRWRSPSQLMYSVCKDLFSYKSWNYAFKDILSYSNVQLRKKADPFDSFEDIMSMSEKWGVTSQFNFMMQKKVGRDCSYDLGHAQDIANKISNRGHSVGVLGTYPSYNQSLLLKEEKNIFEQQFSLKAERISLPDLQFENPTTWQLASDLGYKEISSAALPNLWGFSSGTCYSYSAFNIHTRKKLNLKESPLIIHDQYLEANLSFITVSKAIERIERLKNLVRQYSGDLVISWQNSHFKIPAWEAYQSAYESVFI